MLADTVINRLFDGAHYLDILIETPEPEDIFRPGNLARIEALQVYLETLPHVGGTTSVVDYLKQMNRSLNAGGADAYTLPDDKDLIARYFLLYSASVDPTDFQEKADYDYRLANVRVSMDSGRYADQKVVFEAARHYLDETFNAAGGSSGIRANLSCVLGLVRHCRHLCQRPVFSKPVNRLSRRDPPSGSGY